MGALAHQLGAACCLLAFDVSVEDWCEPRVVRAVTDAALILAEHGVRAAVEYIPYTALSTIAEARELCDRIGWDCAGLCVDSFHTLVADQLDELGGVDPDEIVLVQFCDALQPMDGGIAESSRHHRVVPGAGDLPLGEFVSVIKDLQFFSGIVSAEVLSSAVRGGPPDDFAAACRNALLSYWSG